MHQRLGVVQLTGLCKVQEVVTKGVPNTWTINFDTTNKLRVHFRILLHKNHMISAFISSPVIQLRTDTLVADMHYSICITIYATKAQCSCKWIILHDCFKSPSSLYFVRKLREIVSVREASVTFNSVIYNYRNLKKLLSTKQNVTEEMFSWFQVKKLVNTAFIFLAYLVIPLYINCIIENWLNIWYPLRKENDWGKFNFLVQ